MQRALAIAESAVPAQTTPLLDFDRDIDTKILKIDCSVQVDMGSVREAIGPWLKLAYLQPDAVVLEGENIGQKFVLRFRGTDGLAQSRCKKMFALLRQGPGNWTQYFANTADGGTSRLFINQDRNRKQMRTNQATKRLDTVLRAAMGESAARAKLFTNKKDGIISAGWAPFVRVQCRSDEDTHTWSGTKPKHRSSV